MLSSVSEIYLIVFHGMQSLFLYCLHINEFVIPPCRPQKKKEKMVLPKGPFWEHVEEIPGGRRRCKFCGHLLSNQTPITRFKHHWSGVQSGGVTICDKVPQDVQAALSAAVDGPPEKKRKTTATSNNDGAYNTMSTSLLEQNSEVGNVVTDAETEPEWYFHSPGELEFVQMNMGNFQLDRVCSFPRDLIPVAPGTAVGREQVEQECERNTRDNITFSLEDHDNEGMITGLNQLVVRGGSPERLTANEDKPRGDSSQPADLQCLGLERNYDQQCSSSVNNDVMMIDVENMIREHVQPAARDRSLRGLQCNGDESRGDSFPDKKLVGGEFEENKKRHIRYRDQIRSANNALRELRLNIRRFKLELRPAIDFMRYLTPYWTQSEIDEVSEQIAVLSSRIAVFQERIEHIEFMYNCNNIG